MSNKANEINGTVNVGYGNFIMASRVIAILESGSLPMKRLRDKASENNLLVDATAGRKMRSLIVVDTNHIVLSALAPQTVQERLQEGLRSFSLAQLELKHGEFVS